MKRCAKTAHDKTDWKLSNITLNNIIGNIFSVSKIPAEVHYALQGPLNKHIYSHVENAISSRSICLPIHIKLLMVLTLAT